MIRSLCMKEIKMTSSVIARTLTLAKRMVDDSKYRKGKGTGAGNHRHKFATGSSYILSIIKHAKPDRGILCRRCERYILPNARCYSKSGNPDLSTRVYYHIECAEKLYQE